MGLDHRLRPIFFNEAIKGLGASLDDAVKFGCLRSALISERKARLK